MDSIFKVLGFIGIDVFGSINFKFFFFIWNFYCIFIIIIYYYGGEWKVMIFEKNINDKREGL